MSLLRSGFAALLLVALAAAAPERDLLRDEAHNFRIVGELPPGWQRRPDTLVFAYAVDGIPHAHVHLIVERLRADVDVEAQLKQRVEHYRFPGMPDGDEGAVARADWSGLDAWRYELKTTVHGVACLRRVTAFCARAIWYEKIETLYGAATPEDANCSGGLRVFERGFRLLAAPVAAAELEAAGERAVADAELGFSLVKPAGFRRVDVDPAADPGCRVAFEVQGPGGRSVRVRFFELGVREAFEPKTWLDSWYGSFGVQHKGAQRATETPPAIAGAREVAAEVWSGEREGVAVRTRVFFMQAPSGRVFALRIRTTEGADADYAAGITRLLTALELR